jgi:hypothetical protein
MVWSSHAVLRMVITAVKQVMSTRCRMKWEAGGG